MTRDQAHVLYDDMRSFGTSMCQARLSNPGVKLVCFKDDIKGAFLTVFAHPLWQIHQIVEIDGQLYMIHTLVFGTRTSTRNFCGLSSLICWISIRKLHLIGLHCYMDDFFGWDRADNLILFHGSRRPRKQVQLLILWDFLGVPWEL